MRKGNWDKAASYRLRQAAMVMGAMLAGTAGTAAAARVAMDGWSVQLPTGCTAQWQRVAANPLYDAQARKDLAADPRYLLKPDFNNMPEHLSLDLSACFPQSGGFGTALRVIPLQPYLEIYDSRDGEHAKWAAQTLTKLRAWINAGGGSIADWPFLPFVDASAAHTAWRRSLNFDQGKGVRVVTQMVIENGFAIGDEFDYLFQGLSNDGQYFVLLTVPVTINGLAAAADKTHLGFDVERVYADQDTYRRYSKAVSRWLRSGAALPQPAPETLDELLTSLRRTEKKAER